MHTITNLAVLIQSFFEHHLVSERGLSGHTVLAYRDAVKLFLEFATQRCGKPCTKLTIEDLSADMVRRFLEHLERSRHNVVRTRNNRLAAIHSLFRYLAAVEPRHLARCQSVLAVAFKRQVQAVPEYLEREEVLSIMQHIDLRNPLGRRDDALFRMLYNTGMRAQELVTLNVNHVRFSRPYYVHIHGKGHKDRTCPLWRETVQALKGYLEERSVRFTDATPLFVNSEGERITRFGVRYVVRHRISTAAKDCPSLLTRKVSPHTLRHTTAMHLLQSGVDLNMIRSWLGHASIETTHGYVEIDLEMKRKTLQSCQRLLPKQRQGQPSWQRNTDILQWLEGL